jgi:hypothetical protein
VSTNWPCGACDLSQREDGLWSLWVSCPITSVWWICGQWGHSRGVWKGGSSFLKTCGSSGSSRASIASSLGLFSYDQGDALIEERVLAQAIKECTHSTTILLSFTKLA